MTLREYVATVLPLIRCVREFQKDTSVAYSQVLYLYRQAFYGFEEFGRKCHSLAAQEAYSRLKRGGLITDMAGRNQKKFDQGKKDGQFHFEHVYSGTMFRADVSAIPSDQLTSDRLERLVRENYCVAWILKSENRRLDKAGYRSKGVGGELSTEARLLAYKEMGIDVVEVLNPTHVNTTKGANVGE